MSSWSDLLDEAQEVAGCEWWEPVPEKDLRSVLERRTKGGVLKLLDEDKLHRVEQWRRYDVSDGDGEAEYRWYCSRGDEPRPEEFRLFHDLLTQDAPAGYEPYYFRVERAGKAPATKYGSWKDETARLSVDEAVEWMEQGGNVGIAGTPDGPLVNFDIDDGEATSPNDLPETLRARSRSRGQSFHGWGFDPDDEIPNLPTDDLGEIRTRWQYVVAPGSFVASLSSEIPDGAEHAGYYTIKNEAPVPTVGYDDLPDAFKEWNEKREENDTPPEDATSDIELTESQSGNGGGYGESAVFDIKARQLSDSSDPSDRWTSLFHGSDTSANMSISNEGKLQCWRHNVAHGGLQALATLNSRSPSGDTACRKIGKGHKNSNAGSSAYKGDWRLVWWAWEYAKRNGYIPDDDPIPYRVLVNISVRDEVVDADDLVTRSGDNGGEYLGLPDADTYNTALEHVQDEYDINPARGELDSPEDPVALLPHDSGGSWSGESITVDAVREKTKDTITQALSNGLEHLVDVPPTAGKSYGTVAAAAEPETPPVTLLTLRGKNEQYDQFLEWAEQHGIKAKRLPSLFDDCPSAAGEYSEEIQEKIRNLYSRGATGKTIHKFFERITGEPLPCQHEGESGTCEYAHKWNFEADEYDLLVGHYVHSYNKKVVAGRGVVFDEFPLEAFEHEYDHMEGAVSYFLQQRDDIPYEDWADLAGNRDDHDRRADALVAMTGRGVETDERSVLESERAHAAAPLAAFTVLCGADHGNNLGNGYETAPFPDSDDGRVGVYNRETNTPHVLAPPELDSAKSVVGLDGTPTVELWKMALGVDLSHRKILSDEQRAEYITGSEALDLDIIKTTEYVKPYNSEQNVNSDDDSALLQAMRDRHPETEIGLISTKTAFEEYDKGGLMNCDLSEGVVTDGPVDKIRWYGNVLGSNKMAETRVGGVFGSNHFGDEYIKKMAAYAGETAERENGKGQELSYGEFGDKILKHMREHDTVQAALRFGRDGGGATVYVHTDAWPDSYPVTGEGEVIRPQSNGERQVIDAVKDREYWTTSDIIDLVDVGERRVRQILNNLYDRGYLDRGQCVDDGRKVRWENNGLEEIAEHVELPELDTGEESGKDRMEYIYTWISATGGVATPTTTGQSTFNDVATDGGGPVTDDSDGPPSGGDQ